MNSVELLFKNKAIVRGGLLLFSKNDAVQFVWECQKENIKILGIDSFKIIADKIQPSLENSCDFSKTNETKNYDKAVDFITKRSDEFYFEITSDD
jgi:hypothetical protein